MSVKIRVRDTSETVVVYPEVQDQRYRVRHVHEVGLHLNIPTMSTPVFSNVLSLGMIRGEIFSCCQKGGGKEDKKDEYKIQVCTLQ